MFLLVLLWSGYNTGIYVVQAPGFPANTNQLVQGVRAFFPLVAGWLALLTLLLRGGAKVRALAGPIGLLGLFAATGLISSGFISMNPGSALYWGAMFTSVVLVLFAVCSGEQTLPVLARLMDANWVVDILIWLGLLGAIPFLGRGALAPTTGSPVGVIAYNGLVASHKTLLGMSSTRNTGFARYAAVAGLVALARLWKGKLPTRLVWVAILLAALYTLVLCQARTETISFFAGVLLILALRKSRRVVLLGAGTLGVVLLGLVGFFHHLWVFGTRGQGFSPTLTGRTVQWSEGLRATMQSPWLGLGFQADRYYVHGAQMEGAVFQALIQAGVLGTVAFVAAFALAWYLCIRLYTSRVSRRLPDEVPGILAFFTVMSITESTAFYGSDWMLLAPVLAYIQIAAWEYGILGQTRSVFPRRRVSLSPAKPAVNLG